MLKPKQVYYFDKTYRKYPISSLKMSKSLKLWKLLEEKGNETLKNQIRPRGGPDSRKEAQCLLIKLGLNRLMSCFKMRMFESFRFREKWRYFCNSGREQSFLRFDGQVVNKG